MRIGRVLIWQEMINDAPGKLHWLLCMFWTFSLLWPPLHSHYNPTQRLLGLGTEDAENRVGTADGENSLNDDALDTDGHFKAKGHFMTNFKTKGHSMNNSMTNCVFGIMTKNRAEQQAHK